MTSAQFTRRTQRESKLLRDPVSGPALHEARNTGTAGPRDYHCLHRGFRGSIMRIRSLHFFGAGVSSDANLAWADNSDLHVCLFPVAASAEAAWSIHECATRQVRVRSGHGASPVRSQERRRLRDT
jgi:hypothetical protein